MEDEATCISAIICGRETGKGLKLGDLSDAYEEYQPHLKEGHPALVMLLDRFDEVAIDAEEDALGRVKQVSLPSEAEAKLREAIIAWRSPEERPGGLGAPLFTQAKEIIEQLRLEHEQVLIARLPMVNNQEAYAATLAEVEREFVGMRTILRGQVRGGRNRHRQLLELELQTMYGWPPTGPGPSLKRAARTYVTEIGDDHPLVSDFVIAARRHIQMKEEKCTNEMMPLEKAILRFRYLLNADPPAPKLMREGYKEELNEKCLEAMQRLQVWEKELGTDSEAYLRFLRSTLGEESFLDHCEVQAVEIADELRAYGPRPLPGFEENYITEARAVGATSLLHWLEVLETKGRKTVAAQQRAKVPASELKRVDDWVAMFKVKEEDEDGWHKPPGFEKVDSPDKALAKPPTPPAEKQIRLERELPGMKAGEAMTMRLHGVSFEDVDRHNEILLLEMCADIIAEECKIPRDCILNLSFADPKKPSKAATDAPPVDAELSHAELPDGATSKELMVDGAAPAADNFSESFGNPLI